MLATHILRLAGKMPRGEIESALSRCHNRVFWKGGAGARDTCHPMIVCGLIFVGFSSALDILNAWSAIYSAIPPGMD